jgi:cysteine desulfurase / selenocysteine lyase
MKNINNNFNFIDKNPDKIYLDSASTTLRHNCILSGTKEYLENYNVNLGRTFGENAYRLQDKVDMIRSKIKQTYNASNLFFSYGATDGLNQIIGILHTNDLINKDSKVVIGIDSHHATILPLYQIGIMPQYIYLDNNLNLDIQSILSLNYIPDLICLTLCSNVLGNMITNQDIKAVRQKFPSSYIVLDATQYLASSSIDFDDLGVDAIVASFHKMYGPTGLGIVLYSDRFKNLKPFRVGGGIIIDVSQQDVEYLKDGDQFEAGTINLDGLLGLDSLMDFLIKDVYNNNLNFDLKGINNLKNIKIHSSPNSNRIISFTHETMNNYDLASYLAMYNIIMRVGKHCCNPLMQYLGLDDGTLRISLGVYNTQQDIDTLVEVLKNIP